MTRFIDAQAMHRKHPKTFEVPSVASISALKPGDHVKIAAIVGGKGNPSAERFWVKLTKTGKQLEGTVANDLAFVKLKHGAKVRFSPKNIYATMPQKKSLFGKLFSNPTDDGEIDWTAPIVTAMTAVANPRVRVQRLMR